MSNPILWRSLGTPRLSFVAILFSWISVVAHASDNPVEFDVLKVQSCSTSGGNGLYRRVETSPGVLKTFRDRPVYQMTKSGTTYSLYYRNDTVEWVLDKNAVGDSADGTFSKVTTFGESHPSRALWNNSCRVFSHQVSFVATDYPTATGFYTITGSNYGLPIYTLAGTTWKLYYNSKGPQWVLDEGAVSNSNFYGVKARAQKSEKNPLRAVWPTGFSIEPAAEFHYRRLEEEQEPWSLSLASWNMNNYGQSKGSVDGLVDHYASIISQYDIVFIQELAEPSPPNEYWNRLCQRIKALNAAYVCKTPGSKAGQSGNYYQSALFYHPAPRGRALAVTNYGDSTAAGFTRQPLLATFSYAIDNGPFTFNAYSLHASLSNVNGELTTLENNVALQADAVVLGDLNADCDYFSLAQEYSRFHTWYWPITRGHKTNVRGLRNCAYDRIITRGQPTQHYASRTIRTQGISYNPVSFDNDRNNPAAGQSSKRISDHYLVAIEFGGESTKKKRRKLELTVEEAGTKKIKKDLTLTDPNPTIQTDVVVAPNQKVTLHAVYAQVPANFDGNEIIHFEGFSAWSNELTANETGRIPDAEMEMYRMAPFPHRLVLDVNNDGIYDRNAGDYVNPGDAADFLILQEREGLDSVFTLDDRGVRRERFNINVGKNVFAAAQNLGAVGDMDIYIVSAKKLRNAGYLDWNRSIPSLENYSIAINGARRQTSTVTSSQSFFENIWPEPSDLFTRAPDNAALSSAIAEYGRKFNVVVDVNRNGQFDPGTDKVDTHNIAHIKTWASHQASLPAEQRKSLREAATSYPTAVMEFKAFLNAKMGLDLDMTSGEYDAATAVAALQYSCSPDLPYSLFPVVERGAQVGFQLFSADEVYENEQFRTNAFHYADVDLMNSVILTDQDVCSFAEHNISVSGLKMEPNSSATFIAEGKADINGEVESCNGVALVTGSLEEVAALGLEFLGGALTIFSFGTGTAPAAGAAVEGILIGNDGFTRIWNSGCI